MEIILEKLNLVNFKGQRSLSIDFTGNTNIFGRNESGKTTVLDAWLWLLFGKDSTDRKTFEIKTLTLDNQPLHHLDHEVSGNILVDGAPVTLKKVLRENWVTKKGEPVPELKGHNTAYFWNEVPLKENEYLAKISGLVSEELFKALTNIFYFNTQLKWEQRRAVLLKMAGNISELDIIEKLVTPENKHILDQITTAMNQRKTLEEFKKQTAAQHKTVRDEMALLPGRIDEATRSLPDEQNWSALSAQVAEKTEEIETIDRVLNDKSEAVKLESKKKTELLKQIQELTTTKLNKEFDIRNSFQQKKRERELSIKTLQRQLNDATSDLNKAKLELSQKESDHAAGTEKLEAAYNEYDQADEEQIKFDPNAFQCPTCNTPFAEDKRMVMELELTKKFNENKAKTLELIRQKGTKLKAELELNAKKQIELKEIISKLTEDIAKFSNLLSSQVDLNNEMSTNEEQIIKDTIEGNEELLALEEKMKLLNEEINKPSAVDDKPNPVLVEQKNLLTTEIAQLNKLLGTKEGREKTLSRINELKLSQQDMAAKIADYDGVLYWIEKINRARMNELVDRINHKFNLVTFKMFEEQLNGAVSDCCETLVKGVPYSDLNTAAKINAGLDIINTLQNHYNTRVPVFIDNRESVTEIVPMSSQIINLVVSPEDKKLRVE